MITPIGMHTDPNTGETRERYLIFGRTVKDAQVRTVGQKGTAMLTLYVSPGRDEDLLAVKLWGFDAQDNNGLPKGTVVLVDATKEEREYNGKKYVDYAPINFEVLGLEKPEQKKSKGRTRNVEPENPQGFTDINSEDLPF